MTITLGPLTLIALLVGLLGVVIFWHIAAEYNRRIAALEQRANQEEQRRQAIESVSGLRRHYTYNTVAGLGDAIAVILDSQADLEAAKARHSTALSILASLRTNPAEYDPDQPAGPRKVNNRS